MVIAQIAPAVRVAIAETIGLPPGAVTIGQMVTGLRQIGFDYVFGELLTQQLLAVVSMAENLLAAALSKLLLIADLQRGRQPHLSLTSVTCSAIHWRACKTSPQANLLHPLTVVTVALTAGRCPPSADTLFGADLTIMEEGTELLHRLKAHLQNVRQRHLELQLTGLLLSKRAVVAFMTAEQNGHHHQIVQRQSRPQQRGYLRALLFSS